MTFRGQAESPAARYRVGFGMLASLLAGRASYRLVILSTTVLLLPVWGEQLYGTFAAALASFSWLTALVFTGPEKTVLKLMPRAPRTGAAVTAGLLAVMWWLPLPLAAVFLLVRVVDGTGPAALYVGVAAMQLGAGCTMMLVGMHRAAGRPRSDTATFLVMSTAQLILLGTAVTGHLEPVGYVGAVIVIHLGANLALSVSLGRPSLRIRHRPQFLRRLGLTAVLLSGTDLFLYLTTAVLFAILAASHFSGELGRLYVVVLCWSVGVNLLIYLLRVYAPLTSLRLAGRAGDAGRDRAARMAARVAAFNAVWLVCAGLAVALTGWESASSPVQQLLVWAALLATRAPAVAVLLWASFLLENTDSTAPRVVGLAAVAGLGTAAVAGLATIPAYGGVAVIVSAATGELVYAVVISLIGRRRGVPLEAPPAGEVKPPAPRAARGPAYRAGRTGRW